MRKGGGKGKGTNFERQIHKKFSLWLTSGKRDDLLGKSVLSGGRATNEMKKRKRPIRLGEGKDLKFRDQAGDMALMNYDPRAKKFIDTFLLECKALKIIHITSMLYGKPKTDSLIGFWDKLIDAAILWEKIPLLVFRENFRPIMVCTDSMGTQLCGTQWASVFFPEQRGTRVKGVYLGNFETFLRVSGDLMGLNYQKEDGVPEIKTFWE